MKHFITEDGSILASHKDDQEVSYDETRIVWLPDSVKIDRTGDGLPLLPKEYQNKDNSSLLLKKPLDPVQFEAIVTMLGFKPGEIESVISYLIDDPVGQAVALAKFRKAAKYHRDNPLFGMLSDLVGMTSKELDQAWIQAAQIA